METRRSARNETLGKINKAKDDYFSDLSKSYLILREVSNPVGQLQTKLETRKGFPTSPRY